MLSQILIKNDQGDFVNFKPLTPEDAVADSNEVIRPLPKQKGSGYFSSFSICEGLGMGICRCKFAEDYMARFTLKNSFFSLGFCIKGHDFYWDSCRPGGVTIAPGRSYALFFEDRVAERKIKGQQEVLMLAIHVSFDLLIKLFKSAHSREAQSGDPPEKRLKAVIFMKTTS